MFEDPDTNFAMMVLFGAASIILAGLFALWIYRSFRKEIHRVFFEKLDADQNSGQQFGCFSYSAREWKYVLQTEFSENILREVLTKPGIFRLANPESLPEFGRVHFLEDRIVITDRQTYKTFKINNVNKLGFGSYLIKINYKTGSTDLLQLNVKHAMLVDQRLRIEHSFYEIPIPVAARDEIANITTRYEDLIREELFLENFGDRVNSDRLIFK